MTSFDASNDDESDSETDSPRFDDWMNPATNWEASDRSVKADPEEWVYAIDQLPPDTQELEQRHQSTEQSDGSGRSESTEGDD